MALEKEKQKAWRESKEKARQLEEGESNLAPSPALCGPGVFPRLPLSAPSPSLSCTTGEAQQGDEGKPSWAALGALGTSEGKPLMPHCVTRGVGASHSQSLEAGLNVTTIHYACH